MGSERNPQLASILWALKNSSEAGKEPSAVPNSVSHASSNSTAVIKQPPQIDRSLATAHPGRRPAQLSADPSKITTWAPAQKYVIENIYSNQAQTLRIKQLITNQQCQEKRWWAERDRKSTRLNSSHSQISYAVFCLKKKKPAAHAEPRLRLVLLGLARGLPQCAGQPPLGLLLRPTAYYLRPGIALRQVH